MLVMKNYNVHQTECKMEELLFMQVYWGKGGGGGGGMGLNQN